MDNWYYINMYTLSDGVIVSVFTDKNDVHNTKLEVEHHNQGKNLLLEGNNKLSKVSEVVYPDKKSIFTISNLLYHEISQDNISKLFDCTWYNQLVCGKEE